MMQLYKLAGVVIVLGVVAQMAFWIGLFWLMYKVVVWIGV